MNLLPKSHQDFSRTEYWNSFFKKRGTKAFEWYGEYLELSEHLHQYIKTKDGILVLGCGNSTLSADLYDIGYTHMINIDISHIAINHMIQANKQKRPNMKFLHMDALDMSFEDGQFSVVLDKGTLDALMTDGSDEVNARAEKYFSEISRVLRFSGRYICISLLQEHIIKKILDYFPKHDWMVRILRCHEAEKRSVENGENSVMPVFFVVITKFKKLPKMMLELSLSGEMLTRVSNPEEVISAISSIQSVALVTNGLANSSLNETEEICFQLTDPENNQTRYTLHVLDQSVTRNNRKFAAFIVPQGRELDWLFSTMEGRKQLLKTAGFTRLAVISMHRDQVYENLDAVKEELSDSVKSLAPRGMSEQIPFLSLGNDVGKRVVVHKGSSSLSGDFVIEEVKGEDGETFRRLVFLDNQFVVQSESKLKQVKRGGKKRLVVDVGYLACEHHVYMTVGIQLALQQIESSSGHAAIIGLGGGGLCTFLHKCFESLQITAVDIDKEMLTIAQKFFGLPSDERLKICIEDGIEFLKNSKENGTKYDSILFDVDSKDRSVGMSCPPKQFLDKEVLTCVKHCLNENGFFILNLVCRDEDLRLQAINSLKEEFNSLVSYKVDQEVNEIIFCSNSSKNKWSEEFKKASDLINACVIEKKLQNKEIIDVKMFLESIKYEL